jgi:hypothetical protein
LLFGAAPEAFTELDFGAAVRDAAVRGAVVRDPLEDALEVGLVLTDD